MSTNTNTKVPNPANPSSLKPRYEIRQLKPEHFPWVVAVLLHSNLFHSPVWPNVYPEKLTERLFKGVEDAEYLIMHQINSGLSYGVFDTEYQFEREESKATGGKLYWDKNEKGVQEEQGREAEAQRLLQQMDFPLVSIALSYDAFNHFEEEKLGPIMALLPAFGLLYHVLAERDTRDPKSWEPTGPGEVVFRNATSTRHDYEGERLMAGQARWLMREMDSKGFRGIQIECVHDAVDHVWSKPPKPYKGISVSEFDTATYRDEEGGAPYGPAKQRITKVYVELKPKV